MTKWHTEWKSDHPLFRRFSPGTKVFLEEHAEDLLRWLDSSSRLIDQFKIYNNGMTFGRMVIIILEAGMALAFVFFETRSILSVSSDDLNWMFAHDPDGLILYVLRSILIFVALPFLAIFKLLDYFDMTPEHHVFETKLFYHTIYICIISLIIMRLIDRFLNS